MDSSLLSILGSIAQVYASILGIMGMYMVFQKQRKDDRIRDLNIQFTTKANSLMDFINREIAPAYSNESLIRVDTRDYELVLKAIEQYRFERKEEIPTISTRDMKTFLTLWAFVDKERDDLVQLSVLLVHSSKEVMSSNTLMFFMGYFTFELFFSFLSMYFVFINHNLQYSIPGLNIIFALIGLFPRANMIYNLR